MTTNPQASDTADDRSSTDAWSIGRILQWTAGHFVSKGIDSARLDAELLLANVLEKNRVYLYTHYDQPLTMRERDAYRELVRRRARREPVAYILGQREFYGRNFRLTSDVLVPRPETEHLVDAVRDWLAVEPQRALAAPRVVDVGTGSGIIAVTLAALFPAAEVVAVDVSPAALRIARSNAELHGCGEHIRFCEGNLLAAVPAAAGGEQPGELFNIIAANLPYIPQSDASSLEPEVRDFEPSLALFSGDDGLDLVRRLISVLPLYLAAPGLVALEIGAGQWTQVRKLLEAVPGLSLIRAVADLQGHPRVALAERVVVSNP